MTFSLINIELSKSMQRLCALASEPSCSSSPPSPPSEEARARIIEEAKAYTEKRLEKCNPSIPQQRLTLRCSGFLLRKLDFVTKLQWSILRHGGPRRVGPHAEFATDQNLSEALGIMERKIDGVGDIADGLLAQFAWVGRAYPQYHATMYVLWHLCVRPEGPSAEKAWAAVDAEFSAEMQDRFAVGHASKRSVLAALRSKALLARGRARGGAGPAFVGPNGRDVNLESPPRSEPPRSEHPVPGLSEGLYNGAEDGEFPYSDGDVEWPDWTTLVQGFQLDSSDIFFSL